MSVPSPKTLELEAVLATLKPEDLERAKDILSPSEQEMLAALIERHRWDQDRRKLYQYYPETGPLRRELYGKHMEFFAAGAQHQERAIVAANRVGKTLCLCYEAACHMTGWYPSWWVGRRFPGPVTVWLAGEDAKAVRESLQVTMLGKPDALGTGMIPFDDIIGKPTSRAGVAEAYDSFSVKHVSGKASRGTLKSYDQGRESFQAAKVDIVIYDEEPPLPIYTEGLTRTMSTEPGKPNGIVMCGFTPLKGLSATVLRFLPGGKVDAQPGRAA